MVKSGSLNGSLRAKSPYRAWGVSTDVVGMTEPAGWGGDATVSRYDHGSCVTKSGKQGRGLAARTNSGQLSLIVQLF